MTLPIIQGAVSSPTQTGGGGGTPPSDNIISDLFTNNVEGVWYDPSDLSTLFQDYNGTPAVLEGPVRLMLDKSKGLQLGPERLTNGNFSSSSNWTNGIPTSQVGSAIIQNNKLLIDNPPQSQGSYSYVAFQSLSANNKALEPCKVYKLTGTISDYVRGGLGFFIQNTPQDLDVGAPKNLINGFQGNGNFTCYFTTTKTVGYSNYTLTAQPVLNYFQIITPGGGKFSLSNLSLKEIKGNHAFSMPWQVSLQNTNYVPKLSARVNLLTGTDSWVTGTKSTIFLGSITPYTSPGLSPRTPMAVAVGRKPLKLSFSGAGTVKLTFTGSTSTNYTQGTYTINFPSNVSTVEVECISGTVNNIDLRYGTYGSQLPSYQRVTSSSNYDTSGFPYYLQFGTDYVDPPQSFPGFLATNPKIFTQSQNKLTTWVGMISTENQWYSQLFTFPTFYSYNLYPALGSQYLAVQSLDILLNTPNINWTLIGYTTGVSTPPQNYKSIPPTVGLDLNFPLSFVTQSSYNWLEKSTNCILYKVNGITPGPGPGQSGYDLANLSGPMKPENVLYLGAYTVGDYGPGLGVPGNYNASGQPVDETWQGKLYSLIIRGTESTATEISNIGQWVSNKMGGGFWT